MYSLYEIYWYIEWKKVKSSCSSPLFRHDVLSTISLEVCRGSLDAPQDTAAANLPKIESCSWTCNFSRAQVKHRSQGFFFLEISDLKERTFKLHKHFVFSFKPLLSNVFFRRRFRFEAGGFLRSAFWYSSFWAAQLSGIVTHQKPPDKPIQTNTNQI